MRKLIWGSEVHVLGGEGVGGVEGGRRGIWSEGRGGISDLSQVTPKPTRERPARGEPTVGPGAIHLSDSVSVYTLREW